MTPRRLLILGIAGHLCLLPVALRHRQFWGDGEVLGIPLPALLGAADVAGLFLFVGLAGFSYLALFRQSDQLPVRWLLGGGCLLTLTALVVPPFLSTDVFDYVLFGRVESIHGGNPYLSTPADFPDDPLLRLDVAEWSTNVLPYGPITACFQNWITWLAGNSIWAGVYGFKLLFAGCHVLAAWLIYLALSGRGQHAARRGLLLYLWNPLLLLELAGSGHNDALMAVGLAAMCWGIARERFAVATVAFGTAVLAKHGCAVLGPCLFALAWRRGQLVDMAKGCAIVAVVTAALVARYFLESGALDFWAAQTQIRATSLQHFSVLLGIETFAVLGYGALLAVLLWAVTGIRDGASFGNRGAVLMLAALFAMPMFTPWYHVLWIPLLGVWTWPALDRLVLALGFLAPLSYSVLVATHTLALGHQIAQWSIALALPVGCVGWYASRRREGSSG